MHDDPPPRALPERTGKHFCIRCLAAVLAEEFLRNDHICDKCAASPEYPEPEPIKQHDPPRRRRS